MVREAYFIRVNYGWKYFMDIVENAINSPQCIIGVMGPHAGENIAAIFHRKTLDISRVGKTFWVMKSFKARPVQVQEMCRQHTAYVLFIEPATVGGARPTTGQDFANQYFEDKETWYNFHLV
jgi:hypothetical protein